LPPGTRTLCSDAHGTWSTVDLAFVSTTLEESVLECRTDDSHGSDHESVILRIDVPVTRSGPNSRPSYRSADWEAYGDAIDEYLQSPTLPDQITSVQELELTIFLLTSNITEALERATPARKPSPHNNKYWWTRELTGLRR
ncbi:hypothetical protein DL93DRAFT_2039399, partial [Clavulina sp. PMI_390]